MKPSKRVIGLFMAPAVLAYLLIFLYPTLRTIYLSFFKMPGFGTEMTFRGFKNYFELLRTPLFVESLFNIFKIWSIGGIAIFFLAFLFTALLTSGIRGKNFFRAVIYLPNIISVVAVTTMWTQYIYQPRYGLFKTLFQLLGLESLVKIQWTSQDMLFRSMLIAYVWGAVGWFLLIILAGVERIPNDFYEAAKLDGATMFQSFFLITLPLLRDVLKVSLVMWSITVINLFAFPKTFTPVAQQRATYTPAIYLYELAFGVRGKHALGKAAAVGVGLLILVLVVSALISWLFKKERVEY